MLQGDGCAKAKELMAWGLHLHEVQGRCSTRKKETQGAAKDAEKEGEGELGINNNHNPSSRDMRNLLGEISSLDWCKKRTGVARTSNCA